MTPAEKAIVSLNGLRHGLLGEVILIPGESAEELKRGADRLREALAPVGEMEDLLVDRMIGCAWRLRRAQRIDAGLLTQELYELRRLDVRKDAGRYERDAMKELFAEPAPTITDAAKHAEAMKPLEQIEEAVQAPIPVLAQAFVRVETGNEMLSKLGKYETTLERAFYRAWHELQRLQAVRRGEPVPPPQAYDVDVVTSSTRRDSEP